MTKLIVLGDSIFTGWDGRRNVGDKSVINTLSRELGWETNNQSIGATKFTDNRNGNDDFPGQVTKFNFRDYDAVLLGYGINDFDDKPYASPTQLTDAIKRGTEKIRRDNPNIHIYAELPTPSFVYGVDDQARNGANYTQREIYDTIKQTFRELNVPAYDWRESPLITYDNRMQTLGDGTIHPTDTTQTKMGQTLAYWIKETNRTWNWSAGTSGTSNYVPSNSSVPQEKNYDYVSNPEIDWGDVVTETPPRKLNKEPLKLNQINRINDLNKTFNENVQKIIDSIEMITQVPAGSYSLSLQNFDYFNRAFRNYLISTVLYLKKLSRRELGSTVTVDGGGHEVGVELMALPESLELSEVIATLNSNFVSAQSALNEIIKLLDY